MKIMVAWYKEPGRGRTAEEVVYVVRGQMQKTMFCEDLVVEPSSTELPQQHLEFEVEDFAKGRIPARAISHMLWSSFGIHCAFTAIQEVPGGQFERVDEFAANQEARAKRRYRAMCEAIEALKTSRRWLKDRRFAEIRRDLEQGL